MCVGDVTSSCIWIFIMSLCGHSEDLQENSHLPETHYIWRWNTGSNSRERNSNRTADPCSSGSLVSGRPRKDDRKAHSSLSTSRHLQTSEIILQGFPPPLWCWRAADAYINTAGKLPLIIQQDDPVLLCGSRLNGGYFHRVFHVIFLYLWLLFLFPVSFFFQMDPVILHPKREYIL